MIRLQANPLIDHVAYSYLYLSTVIFLFQSGVPVFCVGLFSSLVLRVFWERQKFRSMRQMRQRGSSSDKLMIALSVTFFALEMPSFFSKVLSQSNLPPIVDSYLVNISNLCIYVDSTLNIFVYLISNPTFRSASLRVTKNCELVNPANDGVCKQRLSSRLKEINRYLEEEAENAPPGHHRTRKCLLPDPK